MGEALREAWLWLVIAFLLGLVVGWLIRSRSVSDAGPKSVTSRVPEAAPVAAAPVAAASSSTPLAAASVATDAKPAAAPVRKPAATKPAATPARKSAAKPAAPLDLAAAKATLGVTVKLDDLKLIEGIGPKIESLLKADGLTTWRAVSKANLERLQGILDEAGPRYSVHNPGTWPTQAGLLADGKFAEFKKLTESLKGGK